MVWVSCKVLGSQQEVVLIVWKSNRMKQKFGSETEQGLCRGYEPGSSRCVDKPKNPPAEKVGPVQARPLNLEVLPPGISQCRFGHRKYRPRTCKPC